MERRNISNKSRRTLGELNRRDFLKFSSQCASVTTLAATSSLLNLSMTKSALAAVGPFNDFKALVCVFFLGGIDSGNLLIPNDTQGYQDYLAIRGGLPNAGGLGLDVGELAAMTDLGSGRDFASPSNMQPLVDIYNAGDLAFIANVGTLIQPTTFAEYQARSGLPLGLFSHSDGQRAWQTAFPQSRSQFSGWAGRVADILSDSVNDNPAIAMNIALNSVNILQTGNTISPYVVSSGGATELAGYFGSSAKDRILRRTTDGVLDQVYADLLERTFANQSDVSIEGAINYNEATESVVLNTSFPTSSFGRNMERIARSIGAQSSLGQSRQIFYVGVGGWDYHSAVLNSADNRLTDVALSLRAFYDALGELGKQSEVTTFTVSDFARTLSSNGNGSDHAWGANMMAMGGAVNGGEVYGHFPDSLLNPLGPDGDQLNLGRGRLLPTTSVDQYAAELAQWFGIPNDAYLEEVLPNIRNFHAAGGVGGPLGFMS